MRKSYEYDNDYMKVLVTLTLLGLGVFYVYFLMTQFERTITVKTKGTVGSGSGRYMEVYNIITDADDHAYNVTNQFLVLAFRSYENYSKLEVGGTYKVRGYGMRFLSLVPNITDVERLK